MYKIKGATLLTVGVLPSMIFTALEMGIDLVPESKKARIHRVIDESRYSANYKIKKSFSTSLAVKGGYNFDKFTPYIGLGLIGTSWKQNYQFIEDGIMLTNSKKSSFQLGTAHLQEFNLNVVTGSPA